MTPLNLSQWIHVNRSVTRSVNIERDAKNKLMIKRFQVTPTACDTLCRLADALEGELVNAWSLTGAYGTGKSSFCNFLMDLFCADNQTRALCYKKLHDADEKLATRFKTFLSLDNHNPPATGIRAVSRYESLNSTLARGLSSTLQAMSDQPSDVRREHLLEHVNKLSEKEWPATRDIVEAFGTLAEETGRPIFLVVDEFGKNLEFQSHYAEKGDIFALQALAESKSVYVWICLHQAFSSYSGALNRVQREEWQKIQGRFEDRSYIEPPTRSFALIREALSIEPPLPSQKKALVDWASAMRIAISEVTLDGLPHLNVEAIEALYPFHPLSVYLIGELTRRFAQNDRTIFSFLASGEPYAFVDCLRRLESEYKSHLPTLGLDMLYDYFSQTGVFRHTDRSENQRWIEIHTMIASQSGMDQMKTKLLKIIGVLNLLSSVPGILASENMIHAALAPHNSSRREIIDTLKELTEARILLYREYAHEYRLWEGSDFDLDQEVLQARGRVALRPVSELLGEIASRPNLVAARHSVQTGTLREFVVRWCIEDDLPAIVKQPRAENDIDGTVWLILGKQKNSDGLFLSEVASKNNPVIVGYAPCLDQVRQLMLEAAATKDACNAPQLERDGVARREARYRAAQSAEALVLYLNEVLSPSSNSVTWFAEGTTKTIRNYRQLSALASDLCDQIYAQCPRINNEMLNSERISSMAAAARNRVAEALANQYACEDLNLTGFGPEVAVYRTVIKDTGLHRKNFEGDWILSAPDEQRQPQLAAVWDLFDRLLAEAENAGEALPVRKMLDTLKKPPFGLRAGPAPLLLSHYLLLHADEIAVYEENVFRPFFGDAEVTLLMRRPELFSLRSYKTSGVRSEVIRTYYQVVNTELKLADRVRNKTLLSIVVPLTEFVKSLPEYTQTTRSISSNALRLRNAITNARDPQQLLFRDIPEALGFSAVDVDNGSASIVTDATNLRKALWNALTELRDAFNAFAMKLRGRFIIAMSDTQTVPQSLEKIRHNLRQISSPLLEICLDPDLKPVLAAFASEKDEDNKWLLQVSAIVMQKSVQVWQDADIEPFAIRLEELRKRVLQLHDLKRLSDREDCTDQTTRFVCIVRPDGSIALKTIQIPGKRTTRMQEIIAVIENSDQETRSSLLANLLESMDKRGDFK